MREVLPSQFYFLFFVRCQYCVLNGFAKFRRNRMRNIPMLTLPRMRLRGILLPLGLSRRLQMSTALTAVTTVNDISMPASRARFFEAPGRHRYKVSFAAFDNFDIPHDKTIVKGNGCERTQLFVVVFFLENPDFCNLHRRQPSSILA